MGLVFGNPESEYIVNFATDNAYCLLSVISNADGSILYQNKITGNPDRGYISETVVEDI